MKLLARSDVRVMIKEWWERIPEKFPHVKMDEFIIMPDHVHGLLFIEDQFFDNDRKVIETPLGLNPCVQARDWQTHGSASSEENQSTAAR